VTRLLTRGGGYAARAPHLQAGTRPPAPGGRGRSEVSARISRMRLSGIRVANFRSLQNVSIGPLAPLSVLIGRNNAGKSSAFSALQALRTSGFGQEMDGRVVTDLTPPWFFDITTTLELTDTGSECDFRISDPSMRPDRMARLIQSFLAKQALLEFRVPCDGTSGLLLVSTKIIGEDGNWGTITQRNVADAADLRDETGRTPPLRDVFQHSLLISGTLLDQAVQSAPALRTRLCFVRDREALHASSNHLAALLGYLLERSFFFEPIRHNAGSVQVQYADALASSGSNLAACCLLQCRASSDQPHRPG
jgi:hypothetical protein